MATTTRLIYQAMRSSGDKYNMSFNYVKPAVTEAQAQALGQALVTNGSIFKKMPVAITKITLEEKETTEFDIS